MNESYASPNKSKYYAAAIAAYTMWGFFSLVLKPLHAYTAADILFYRVFSCAILMLLIVVLFKRKKLRQTIQIFKELPANEKRNTIWLNVAGSIFF